jgi:hypothetical protein
LTPNSAPSLEVLLAVVCLPEPGKFIPKPFRPVDEELPLEPIAMQRALHLHRDFQFDGETDDGLLGRGKQRQSVA